RLLLEQVGLLRADHEGALTADHISAAAQVAAEFRIIVAIRVVRAVAVAIRVQSVGGPVAAQVGSVGRRRAADPRNQSAGESIRAQASHALERTEAEGI